LSAPIRRSALARHSSAGSPVGSAAASRRSSRAGGGSGSSCATEALLDAARQRQPPRQREAPGDLRRRQRPWQLAQRERVPARLGDELLAHPRIHHPGEGELEQFPRVVVIEARDDEARQAGEVVVRLAHREHECDPLAPEPPADERERLGRGVIEPLGVVDDAEQRPFARDLGEQPEHREPDEEWARHGTGTQPERDLERLALRHGEEVEVVDHLAAELMEARVGQLHLRLDRDHPLDARGRRSLGDGLLEQRGLADSGLAEDDQRSAAARPRTVDHGTQARELARPPPQDGRIRLLVQRRNGGAVGHESEARRSAGVHGYEPAQP
jgi:hypothetical protein